MRSPGYTGMLGVVVFYSPQQSEKRARDHADHEDTKFSITLPAATGQAPQTRDPRIPVVVSTLL